MRHKIRVVRFIENQEEEIKLYDRLRSEMQTTRLLDAKKGELVLITSCGNKLTDGKYTPEILTVLADKPRAQSLGDTQEFLLSVEHAYLLMNPKIRSDGRLHPRTKIPREIYANESVTQTTSGIYIGVEHISDALRYRPNRRMALYADTKWLEQFQGNRFTRAIPFALRRFFIEDPKPANKDLETSLSS